jgi:hypothetical protein
MAKSKSAGNKNYSGSIALTKMKHVMMNKKGKKGKKIECIVIPVKANYLVAGKDGAWYMPIRVIIRAEEDDYGQNGFISQSVDTKVWKDASEEEQAKMSELPILGNIKDFTKGSGSSDDSSGSAAKEAIDEEDDLPF